MDAVVIIHRHGARLPSQGFDDDLNFPSSNSVFWNENKDLLLPEGYRQLTTLGTEFRQLYPQFNKIKVYSSNTQRTILSAISFCEAAFNKRLSIRSLGDRCQTDYDDSTIPIFVERTRNEDVFFHVGSDVEELKKKTLDNLSHSREVVLQAILLEEFTKEMFAKVGLEYKPDSLIENFRELEEISVRSAISASSSFKFSGNTTLDKAAQLISEHLYRPASNRVEDELGSLVAGLLMSHICEFLYNESDAVQVYSAHDTTLLAISAMLGWVVPKPNFASYYIFEKTKSGSLNIKYNYSMETIPMASLQPLKWNDNEEYIRYDFELGSTDLHKFCDKFMLISRETLSQLSLDKFPICKERERFLGLFLQLSANKEPITWMTFKQFYERFGINICDKTMLRLFNLFSTDGRMSYEQFNCILSLAQ